MCSMTWSGDKSKLRRTTEETYRVICSTTNQRDVEGNGYKNKNKQATLGNVCHAPGCIKPPVPSPITSVLVSCLCSSFPVFAVASAPPCIFLYALHESAHTYVQLHLPHTWTPPLSFTADNVKMELGRLCPGKADGPDCTHSRLLKDCAA